MTLDADQLTLEGGVDVETGATLSVSPGATLDAGTIQVEGGDLNLRGVFTNDASVLLNTGTVQVGTVRGSASCQHRRHARTKPHSGRPGNPGKRHSRRGKAGDHR